MSPLVDTTSRLVPISLFNKGQSSKIFERVKTERELIVLKNNEPAAVILSLEEYRSLKQAEEDLCLLQIAHQRMQGDWESRTIPAAEVWAQFGLDDTEVEDVEIEFE